MREELRQLEEVIEEGAKGFRAAGEALLAIRERKLYRFHRSEPETWESYCRTRWGVSGRHANRLVEAATLVSELGPIGSQTAHISNERQARELAQVPPAERRKVLEELQQVDRPTATQIRATSLKLAGMSTEQKFQTANIAEVQALRSLKQMERERTLARIDRLCGRLRELHAELPTAAAADEALTHYLVVVRST